MRLPRFISPPASAKTYHHCVTYLGSGNPPLGEDAQQKFLEYMRLYEKFCGLKVLSYCILPDRVHMLMEVPNHPSKDEMPNDEDLVSIVKSCFGDKLGSRLESDLIELRQNGFDLAAEIERKVWLSRMWDLSKFMKILKQRVTQYVNIQRSRSGPLWEERFKSVLVEGESKVLKLVASYIDLSPVRDGICKEPADYKLSGYGEAASESGSEESRSALKDLVAISSTEGGVEAQPQTHEECLESWGRTLLGYDENEPDSKPPAILSRKRALAILNNNGQLDRGNYLRCGVRYFCDGVAIGSKAYIEAVIEENFEYIPKSGKKNLTTLRGLKCADKSEALYVIKNLKKEVFS